MLSDYVHHFVRQESFRDIAQRNFTGTAGQQRVPKSFMERVELPLPPLDEQRRIVDILNRAASIERLRARASSQLRDLIPALFIKMFGDPIDNPMGWEVQPLGDVVKSFQGGKNVQAGSGTSQYRILKVSAVTSGTFDPTEAKAAPDDYDPPIEHRLRAGDLLFSRANTAALVGATAMVERDAPNLLLPDKLWRVVLSDQSPVLVEYLHGFLKMRSTRDAMSRLATGTSASMMNISQAKLKTLPTMAPPLELQQRYAEIVTRLKAKSALVESSGSHVRALSAALTDRLFRAREMGRVEVPEENAA